jgi:beta-lactamase regulating signal transducer with metallopeptidase domain/C-terminal processing protease CtpA/Prc
MSFSWATCGSWLLQSAAAGGVLLLLTQGLARFVRQPARRQRLCEYGVLAALLAAALSLLLPGWLLVPRAGGGPLARGVSAPLDMMLDPTPATVPGANGGQAVGATQVQKIDVTKAVVNPESIEGADEPVPSLGELVLEWSQAWLLPGLVVMQAIGTGLFLGYLLVGHVALLRLLARARPAPPDVVELFLPMLGKGRPPRLLISDKVRVPLSCGLLRPTVVIPANLCEPANARKLRWIFAHELTHLRRRDAWSCLLFCVGQALYFYVPWFWWLRRQAQLCQEFVADAVAALEEVPPVSYAEFLVSLTRAPAVPMAATGVAGQPSDLFRRVSMLLQNPPVERDCPRRWSLLAAGSLLALAVVLSGVSLTAQPAQAQEKEIVIRRSQGEPVKITIYVEGGDKKEPVIRKDEKVKVLVVPGGEKGKKEERIFYWTPRVIIEQKGDDKADGKERKEIHLRVAPGKANETDQGPTRKATSEKKEAGDKDARKEFKVKVFTAPKDFQFWIDGKHVFPEAKDFKFWTDFKFDPNIKLWDAKDGKAWVQFHHKADVNLEKLRKALEKLEKIPNVDAEQIRKEVMKALEQLHKVQPKTGTWRFEFAPEGEKKTEEKKHIERKVIERKSAETKEKVRARFVDGLRQLGTTVENRLRLGVEIDMPGEILADQLNLPKGQGVVIQRVTPKSPAEAAGLKVGDVLLEINRVAVPSDLERFTKIIQVLPGDEALDAVVIRKGKRKVIHGVRLSTAAAAFSPDERVLAIHAAKAGQVAHILNNVAFSPDGKTMAIAEYAKAVTHAKDGAAAARKSNRLNARHQEGTLLITVVGDVGNRDALEITIQDGATSNRYNGLKSVPAQYREKVSRLLDVSSGGK